MVLVKLWFLPKHPTKLLLVGDKKAIFGTVVCTFVVPRARAICSVFEGDDEAEDDVDPA